MIRGLEISVPTPISGKGRGLEIELNHLRPMIYLINHAYIMKLP